ncbi:uncharacterized protein MELLADRAFT_72186 [Melampsora larici-populina 98AG31]|uniref:TLC domain-containing protein n=1 Tax=Melampsora larici-populina (strain 98AG31 / pathotype 3-4-7) TaxID=747676 RepID=F4RQW1_MELLP|nr:uncharacterized protein MELLADRAFT_72186 [Melampsora larici-populina 98AG31]EGG05257.1 hypothetical protein MELLADRAFT_72186 [Melampsora larici-populina 98AG31]
MNSYETLSTYQKNVQISIENLSKSLQLPNLSYHLPTILISCSSCFILQFLSHQFSPKLFPKHYPNLSSFTKFNWDTHFVAWVHSFYGTFIGLYFILDHNDWFRNLHEDKVFGYHPKAMNLLQISTGYFLWDIAVSTLMALKGHGYAFLLHAAGSFVVYFYTMKPLTGYYLFLFLLWETSTIFLNPHWFFDKIGMAGSKAQMFNGIALLLSFFTSRIILGNYVSYKLLVDVFQPDVNKRIGVTNTCIILFVDISLSLLNVHWFYLMITSIKKRMNSKPITSSKKQS